jgi:hypothetical protein
MCINGQTQIFHTIDNDGIFSEFVPLHSFYNRASEDPRFQGLQHIMHVYYINKILI